VGGAHTRTALRSCDQLVLELTTVAERWAHTGNTESFRTSRGRRTKDYIDETAETASTSRTLSVTIVCESAQSPKPRNRPLRPMK
jgi:hypothetical protein